MVGPLIVATAVTTDPCEPTAVGISANAVGDRSRDQKMVKWLTAEDADDLRWLEAKLGRGRGSENGWA